MGETLILDNDQTGWELLARALAEDPQPTSIGGWEQEERPVLAALAAAVRVKSNQTQVSTVS